MGSLAYSNNHGGRNNFWVVIGLYGSFSRWYSYGLTCFSWMAYVFVRKLAKSSKYNGDSDKVLSLSAYTSGIMLLLFAFLILIEAVECFLSPVSINYNEAIFVAIIGLIVNIVSAFLLHHDHEDSDHNIRAAYIHVLADTLTSFSAIIGLIVAKKWNITYIDTLAAVISSVVIIKWSINLLKKSGTKLLDLKRLK